MLATSATTGDKTKEHEYHCVVDRIQNYKTPIMFFRIYLDSGLMFKERTILIPQFFFNEDVAVANCNDLQFLIGRADWVESGKKIHLYTKEVQLNFFGIPFEKEESIYMFGND